MWQVLLGIYIVVVVLIAVMLWASLVVAKRADQNTKNHAPLKLNFTGKSEDSSLNSQRIKLPAMEELIKK